MKEIIVLCLVPESYSKYPFNYGLWAPGGSLTKNFYYNFICEILFHIVPALMLDFLLLLFRQRPM